MIKLLFSLFRLLGSNPELFLAKCCKIPAKSCNTIIFAKQGYVFWRNSRLLEKIKQRGDSLATWKNFYLVTTKAFETLNTKNGSTKSLLKSELFTVSYVAWRSKKSGTARVNASLKVKKSKVRYICKRALFLNLYQFLSAKKYPKR